ncbi:MAG: hypothetical protein ACREDF_04080 [Thermoplasmata archaeon]
MKRHTTGEAIFGFFALTVMMIGCAMDTWRNAQKCAWGWFWFSLFATMFFAGLNGWLAIDAFNRHQRRRRAAQKAD